MKLFMSFSYVGRGHGTYHEGFANEIVDDAPNPLTAESLDEMRDEARNQFKERLGFNSVIITILFYDRIQ